jgi:Right handed beta helix region
VITLEPGVTEVSAEYVVPDGVTLRGAPAGSTLRASADFRGRAVVVLGSGSSVERIAIEGNRRRLAKAAPIAPYDRTFANFYPANGILTVGTEDVSVRDIKITEIANFAVLVSAARHVTIERVEISHSGSLNADGRNNTTGGILLEDGTTDFVVRNCKLQHVRGNGIWTHSRYTAARNARGQIANNRFQEIGRDAVQVGHATEIEVAGNTGSRIGYPLEVVDMEGGGVPVAVDTAGNVDKSVYERNQFLEVNGKCIDLDGFHHGDVRNNTCRNRLTAADYPFGQFGIVFNNTNPDMRSEEIRVIDNVIDGMKFGGIFVIGRGHTIQGNRLVRLNLAGCNESHAMFGCIFDAKEPEMLQTGIYLGRGAERPDLARGNVISGNVISGFRMAERCIAMSPGVDPNSNTIKGNECRNR